LRKPKSGDCKAKAKMMTKECADRIKPLIAKARKDKNKKAYTAAMKIG